MDIHKYLEEALELVQSILKIGPRNVIGMDIGQSSVRIAELSEGKKGEFKLIRFAYEMLPEGCLMEDEILQPDDIINAITTSYKNGSFGNKYINIGICGSNTMSKKLQVADGSESEISDQVTWESEQYIPFGTEEAIISYSIMGKNSGGGVDVMVAAVKKEFIESYKSLFNNTGLKIKIVDLDLFALSNIFEAVYGEKHKNDKDGILLIDFGARKINMVIFHMGIVVFTREIAMGGVIITEEIQRQLGLSFSDAEDLKINGDENGNIPEEIMEIIKINLDNFFNEIRKTLTFFMTAATDITLGSCYITGGTSQTPGLQEGLFKTINVEVLYLNPFDKITYNSSDFNENDVNYIISSGCISLGLALRKLRK